MAGGYQGTQGQWPAGYGVQPQSWPQATQAQGQQQWPATYTEQAAAYGSYNAYESGYAQPQALTSVPQAPTAAYAAYPASYPIQVLVHLHIQTGKVTYHLSVQKAKYKISW